MEINLKEDVECPKCGGHFLGEVDTTDTTTWRKKHVCGAVLDLTIDWVPTIVLVEIADERFSP